MTLETKLILEQYNVFLSKKKTDIRIPKNPSRYPSDNYSIFSEPLFSLNYIKGILRI